MSSKMADENRQLNISDCIADKSEIPNANAYIFVVKECNGNNANYNMLPITKFTEIFNMAFKMAAENRKWNISDCMAD